MTENGLTLNASSAYIADKQNIFITEDFVEVAPVPFSDRMACAERRFVQPTGEEWPSAEANLRRDRVVVLKGFPGYGRRTAALKLLLSVTLSIHELSPAWGRPRTKILPLVQPGHGYLLDMTEPTEHPPENAFGKNLLGWAAEQSVYLVVTTTGSAWSGEWTSGTRRVRVTVGPPEARELVRSELLAMNADYSDALLDASGFASIWKSEPSAADACRLAQLIAASPDRDVADIAREYGNWRTWIDDELHEDLGVRALMWSAAFCDGGKRKTILRMAEAFRSAVGRGRSHEEILADRPSLKRLADAHIEIAGDAVQLSTAKHGLAQAICRHLWEEYEDQREVLIKWLRKEVIKYPRDDTRRIIAAVLDLGIYSRDDSLLAVLRVPLSDGERRAIVIESLSHAVLDPRMGAYVRDRLYAWLRSSRDPKVIDAITEICGGQFGIQEPDLALTRLRLAAQKTLADSRVLADAIGNLALRHPQKVLPAIARWFSDPASSRAGINAFLALSSTLDGAMLLCKRAGLAVGDLEFADTLAGYFQRAFADKHSSERAVFIALQWGAHSQAGELDSELTTRVFAAALAPSTKGSLFGEFPDVGDYRTYWGRVYHEAVTLAARRDSESTAQLGDIPHAVTAESTGRQTMPPTASPMSSTPPIPAEATKETPTASRHPEAAGQQPGAGHNGRHTAPGDGLDTAPALAVRGRPYAAPPPNPATTDA
jgi:hypothetical protein